ncbi:threonine/serine ThrE exporter family protein [Flexivirga alba]|uniref:Threonine/serine exporter ThrE family protein n=1 Tax=Flexivirga alba TaxID=702742 RepID=A0ABW2AK66_9MICO
MTAPTREVLLRMGSALLAGGAPVPDVEWQVTLLARRMGAPGARVAATPTGIFAGLGVDEPVGFEPVAGSLRLEQVTRVQDVYERLMRGGVSDGEALRELDDIEAMPSSRPVWLSDLALVPIGTGICAILQPTWRDLVTAAASSLLVMLLVILSRRFALVRTLLPLLASFTVGVLVLLVAQHWPLHGTLRTMVASFAVLLPGSVIVTGMSEIASGAAVAGSSRLVSGVMQLVLFAAGLFSAVSVTGVQLDALTNVRAQDLGPLAPYIGVLVIGCGIVINVAASRAAIPWILLVLALTFATQSTVQSLSGLVLGALAGATIAGLAAAVVHRLSGRPLRLVVFLPAFWLLVPGSLGLLSTTEIATGRGGFDAITVAIGSVVAVAAGTLIGSAAGRAIDRFLDPAETPDIETLDLTDVDRL